jgi:hypothetical protein
MKGWLAAAGHFGQGRKRLLPNPEFRIGNDRETVWTFSLDDTSQWTGSRNQNLGGQAPDQSFHKAIEQVVKTKCTFVHSVRDSPAAAGYP